MGEVDALREAGGYFALFCGHDHKNSFVGHVHDIDLGLCTHVRVRMLWSQVAVPRHSPV